jgi:hypothetical protein
MYIHPVPPVLRETRAIVMLYNKYYQRMIEELRDDSIRWLPMDLLEFSSRPFFVNEIEQQQHQQIFNSLCALSPELATWAQEEPSLRQLVLKETYQHDGTHLNPTYLHQVEEALNMLTSSSSSSS